MSLGWAWEGEHSRHGFLCRILVLILMHQHQNASSLLLSVQTRSLHSLCNILNIGWVVHQSELLRIAFLYFSEWLFSNSALDLATS